MNVDDFLFKFGMDRDKYVKCFLKSSFIILLAFGYEIYKNGVGNYAIIIIYTIFNSFFFPFIYFSYREKVYKCLDESRAEGLVTYGSRGLYAILYFISFFVFLLMCIVMFIKSISKER